MKKLDVRSLTLSAVIAAVYAALTLLLPGPSYGYAQLRLAEALTVLPFLFPTCAPGLAVGCLIANILSPYGPIDMICGTLATALAAFLTAKAPNKWLAPLPPVLCNGVIVGGMIAWYQAGGLNEKFLPAFALTGPGVALGEIAACYILGMVLLTVLPKINFFQTMMPRRR